MKPLRARSWLIGAAAGAAVAVMVTVPITYADWRLNPAGLFHDDTGTHWDVVFETALSWFVPVALLVFAVVTVAHHLLSKFAQRRAS